MVKLHIGATHASKGARSLCDMSLLVSEYHVVVLTVHSILFLGILRPNLRIADPLLRRPELRFASQKSQLLNLKMVLLVLIFTVDYIRISISTVFLKILIRDQSNSDS